MERKEIMMSKGKATASVGIMSVLAVGSAVLFYLAYANNWVFIFGNWFWLTCTGIAVLGFAAGAVFMFMKLRDPAPAIILEADGYIDNTGLVKGHKFLWADIASFETKSMYGMKMIIPMLQDPEGFIDAQGGMKKKMLKQTYVQNGSPVSIPVKGLDCSFDELLKELNGRLENASANVSTEN